MKTLLSILAGAIFCSIVAKPVVFTPVSGFDLNRYLGTWYEIARFPHWFEKDLTEVTATYSLRPDGKVKVLNKGIKQGSAKPSTAIGKAKFASTSDTGHLMVSFFGPFYSDYIIVDLADDYSYAMVLGNTFDFFWILSRTPNLDPTVISRLIEKAKTLDFDTSRIIMVPQS